MMPKKKRKETPEEQSARFHAEVERMIAAGELNPTEAGEALDRLVSASRRTEEIDVVPRRARGKNINGND